MGSAHRVADHDGTAMTRERVGQGLTVSDEQQLGTVGEFDELGGADDAFDVVA